LGGAKTMNTTEQSTESDSKARPHAVHTGLASLAAMGSVLATSSCCPIGLRAKDREWQSGEVASIEIIRTPLGKRLICKPPGYFLEVDLESHA
jgi:hypothetical protein